MRCLHGYEYKRQAQQVLKKYLPVKTSHSVVQVDANVRSNKGWAATDYKVHCFRCGDHCTRNMMGYRLQANEQHQAPQPVSLCDHKDLACA